MDPKKAISVLDEATQPQNAGRISREGYIAIQEALQYLLDFVNKQEGGD